jgi:hypothetical protein
MALAPESAMYNPAEAGSSSLFLQREALTRFGLNERQIPGSELRRNSKMDDDGAQSSQSEAVKELRWKRIVVRIRS